MKCQLNDKYYHIMIKIASINQEHYKESDRHTTYRPKHKLQITAKEN